MKIAIFFSLISLSFFIFSCNKSEFKESNLGASATSSSMSSPVNSMPEMTGANGLPPGHPPINNQTAGTAESASKEAISIKKIAGGVSIEECFKDKKKLNGKQVKIKGKVVKYNSGILKRNWLHLQDGTGTSGQNDLVVTTLDSAKLNDIVVVSGVLHYDKDIGSGYFFPVIMEDAKVKVEK